MEELLQAIAAGQASSRPGRGGSNQHMALMSRAAAKEGGGRRQRTQSHTKQPDHTKSHQAIRPSQAVRPSSQTTQSQNTKITAKQSDQVYVMHAA